MRNLTYFSAIALLCLLCLCTVACVEEDNASFSFAASAQNDVTQCLNNKFFPFSPDIITVANAGSNGLLIRLNENYAQAIQQNAVVFRMQSANRDHVACPKLDELSPGTFAIDDASCMQMSFFSYDCLDGRLDLVFEGEAELVEASFKSYERVHLKFDGKLVRRQKRQGTDDVYDRTTLGDVNGYFNFAIRPGVLQNDFSPPPINH